NKPASSSGRRRRRAADFGFREAIATNDLETMHSVLLNHGSHSVLIDGRPYQFVVVPALAPLPPA
ncbi:MAG: hypothetical protein ACREBC_35595, partial [Pyrinomonadaceae bacterium]